VDFKSFKSIPAVKGGEECMSHPWRSKGEKRTIVWYYKQPDKILQYLKDMQDAIKYILQVAYRMTLRDEKHRLLPSPITLRREVREWFYSRYDYARHHINPVCRTAVAMLRSYRKNHHGELRIPAMKRMAMRIEGELFKVVEDKARITMQPNNYVWIPINTSNKHYQDYSKGRASELLITDTKICLTFIIKGNAVKPLGNRLIAQDLNFKSVDSTKASLSSSQPSLTSVDNQSLKEIVRIQNDFSRRRRMIQLHVKNLKKLRETRGRQRNRISDALHKLSIKTVRENPDASFVFENLKGIRKTSNGIKKSKKLRMYLNRWPYRLYQSMVEYKSDNRTVYVSPRGTSSKCPVCGGKLEHPVWAVSRCVKCGVDYGSSRNKVQHDSNHHGQKRY